MAKRNNVNVALSYPAPAWAAVLPKGTVIVVDELQPMSEALRAAEANRFAVIRPKGR